MLRRLSVVCSWPTFRCVAVKMPSARLTIDSALKRNKTVLVDSVSFFAATDNAPGRLGRS